MKRFLLFLGVISLILGGAFGNVDATMLYSDNDYGCGLENYASATTIANSLEVGINISVYAGGTQDISIAQLDYGSGDWSTDLPTDMDFLAQNLVSEVGATVTLGSGTYSGNYAAGASLAIDDLFDFDLLFMTGHNPFTINAANTAKLKAYIDGGGVLWVDDCEGSPAVSSFETSFNTLIFNMYGITNASMDVIDPNHLLYSSFYQLDGTNFSYTAAGLGTEWAQIPLKGYENDPGQVVVPEPATMLLLGSGLIGLAGFRRKFRKK